ncbi:MAG: hypothetical protein HY078_13695 [Elusimicrobia bacterium]|nr:hypothetical protein [Elusimicrobiota bacterium]
MTWKAYAALAASLFLTQARRPAAAPRVEPFVQLQAANGAFSIQAPESWRLIEGKGSGLRLILPAQDEHARGPRPVIRLIEYLVGSALYPDALAYASGQPGRISAGPSRTVRGSLLITVFDTMPGSGSVEVTALGAPLRARHIVFQGRSRAWVLILSASAGEFREVLPVLERMAWSFRAEGEDGLGSFLGITKGQPGPARAF